MRKILIIILTTVIALSFCACESTKADVPATQTAPESSASSGKSTATQYDYTLNGEMTVADLIFENTVTVKGENGRILFVNCEFKKDIVNNGGEGAKIMLDPSCVVSGNLVIDSSLKEATQDTDLPKFMAFCPGAKATVGACGSIVSSSDLPITVNDHTYELKDAMFFVNESTGEFAQYDGQQAQYHNVAMWDEAGSNIFMHVAVYSPN